MTDIDFNSADTQDAAFALIPANTLARVYLTIRPGGAGPEGWLTQSKTSEALYLNTEGVIEDGPYSRRRIYTRIGYRGRNGSDGGEDTYANRGRALIRGILESARGVRSDDTSDRARTARTIHSLGEISGLAVAVKLGVDRDRNNPQDEGRNVVLAAIGPQHPEYARLMASASSPAPYAQPTAGQPPAAAQASSNGSAPFWAQ